MTALGQAFRDLVCRPKVPSTVERNLSIAAKAQEIADALKYGEPAMNAEVLTAAAKLLALSVMDLAGDTKTAEVGASTA